MSEQAPSRTHMPLALIFGCTRAMSAAQDQGLPGVCRWRRPYMRGGGTARYGMNGSHCDCTTRSLRL